MVGMLICGAVLADDEGTLDAREAAAHKNGETVSFEDRIVEIVVKESGTVFLNFGASFPNEVLKAIIMDDTRPRFPNALQWEGRRVRVSGVLSEKEGRKRIILRERGQIELVDDPPTDVRRD